MQQDILVALEKSPRNYSAYAPDVPGCIATGKTVDETLRLMKEALQAHLSLTLQEGYPMPEISATEARMVQIDLPETGEAQVAPKQGLLTSRLQRKRRERGSSSEELAAG